MVGGHEITSHSNPLYVKQITTNQGPIYVQYFCENILKTRASLKNKK